MSQIPSRILARIQRLDWRSRGKVHGKKGPIASRYAIRAQAMVNKRIPGGWRWQRIKDKGR